MGGERESRSAWDDDWHMVEDDFQEPEQTTESVTEASVCTFYEAAAELAEPEKTATGFDENKESTTERSQHQEDQACFKATHAANTNASAATVTQGPLSQPQVETASSNKDPVAVDATLALPQVMLPTTTSSPQNPTSANESKDPVPPKKVEGKGTWLDKAFCTRDKIDLNEPTHLGSCMMFDKEAKKWVTTEEWRKRQGLPIPTSVLRYRYRTQASKQPQAPPCTASAPTSVLRNRCATAEGRWTWMGSSLRERFCSSLNLKDLPPLNMVFDEQQNRWVDVPKQEGSQKEINPPPLTPAKPSKRPLWSPKESILPVVKPKKNRYGCRFLRLLFVDLLFIFVGVLILWYSSEAYREDTCAPCQFPLNGEDRQHIEVLLEKYNAIHEAQTVIRDKMSEMLLSENYKKPEITVFLQLLQFAKSESSSVLDRF